MHRPDCPIPGVAMYAADPARTLMVRDRTGTTTRVCGVSVWQPLGFRAVELADHLQALSAACSTAYNAWVVSRTHNPADAEQWRGRVLDLHAQIREWQP